MGSHSFFRVGLAAGALSVALAAAPIDDAKASGPVERMVQVVTSPADPSTLIVRYGAASEGLLFSRDGGRTFRAVCAGAIEAKVKRFSSASWLYNSPLIVDARGHLFINTFDGFWTNDGSGCTWTPDPGTDGKWLTSLKVDPNKPDELLAVANVMGGTDESPEAHPELIRRDAKGVWSVIGPVRKRAAQLQAYGGELVAVKTSTGTRYYVTVIANIGTGPQRTYVAVSDDGGKTWSESKALPANQEFITLLGADPTQPDRLLGVVQADGPEALFVSEDKGKTFKAYGTVQETSGVTFAPDGRIFIGDAGGADEGGVLTAAKLGQPLTKLPNANAGAASVDCVDYDARVNKLRVCKVNRFGELNTQTGAFTELVQFESVKGLIECPDRDIKAVCEGQLNAGSSWCCSGHYPFTGFCGEWDIRESGGRRVACGLSGRAAEIEAGRGPSIPANGSDAGAATPLPSLYSEDPGPSAETPDDAPAAVATAGCSLAGSEPQAAFPASALLGLFGFAAVRRVRRRARVSSRRS